MKYLKRYENLNDSQIGDYAIAVPENLIKDSEHFFNNTIGKILKIEREYLSREKRYAVQYENIPSFIQNYYCVWREKDGKQYHENIIWFAPNMIKHHSRLKEELELVIQSNKYGI